MGHSTANIRIVIVNVNRTNCIAIVPTPSWTRRRYAPTMPNGLRDTHLCPNMIFRLWDVSRSEAF
jgi:hypothetical protein